MPSDYVCNKVYCYHSMVSTVDIFILYLISLFYDTEVSVYLDSRFGHQMRSHTCRTFSKVIPSIYYIDVTCFGVDAFDG